MNERNKNEYKCTHGSIWVKFKACSIKLLKPQLREVCMWNDYIKLIERIEIINWSGGAQAKAQIFENAGEK